MTQIFVFILVLVIILALILTMGVYFRRHPEQDNGNDTPYLDDKGNHQYYDRSLIEKEEYLRRHPEDRGKLRTFSRMFSHNDNEEIKEDKTNEDKS